MSLRELAAFFTRKLGVDRYPPIEEVLPGNLVDLFHAFTRDPETSKRLPPTAQPTMGRWFDFIIALHQLPGAPSEDIGAMIFQWLRSEGFDYEICMHATTGITDALCLLEHYDRLESRL